MLETNLSDEVVTLTTHVNRGKGQCKCEWRTLLKRRWRSPHLFIDGQVSVCAVGFLLTLLSLGGRGVSWRQTCVTGSSQQSTISSQPQHSSFVQRQSQASTPPTTYIAIVKDLSFHPTYDVYSLVFKDISFKYWTTVVLLLLREMCWLCVHAAP